MKEHLTVSKTSPDTVRGGVISLLVLAICFLMTSDHWDLPRVLALIGLVAVCVVLMMKSVSDLLVLIFGLVVQRCGRGLGHSVKALRRFRSWKHTH